MKITIFLCLLTIGAGYLARAQQPAESVISKKASNAIYIEIGGPAVIYSLNYDRIIHECSAWSVGSRVGIGLVSSSFDNTRLVAEVYGLKKSNNHANRFLELGLGFMYRSPRVLTETPTIKDNPALGLSPRIGLRWQKPTGGWVTRVGFTPVISKQSGEAIKFAPWAGLSIGRSF